MNSLQFQQWCNKYSSLSSSTTLTKPLIMGILNVTPDSFSDGGQFMHADEACEKALTLIDRGADIIDIGGESSRPGAASVSVNQELDRVIPVITKIRAITDTVISIDTHKADAMHEAVCAGASMINDINALKGKESLTTAARLRVPVCLMHMNGTPETMQKNPHFKRPVIEEINEFFQSRISACLNAGIKKSHLILDPGFGFGKSLQHNLLLIKYFKSFQQHNLPLLLGVSRKSTLGTILDKAVNERVIGGLTMAVLASMQGMSIIRTHDVEETSQAFKIINAINNAKEEASV